MRDRTPGASNRVTKQTRELERRERSGGPLKPCRLQGVKLACLILIGAVAAAGNDLALAEAVSLADSVAAILLADAEEVGRRKAPIPVSRADFGGGLAVGKVGHRHLGGFGVDCVGVDADHGADGEKAIDNSAEPEAEIKLAFGSIHPMYPLSRRL